MCLPQILVVDCLKTFVEITCSWQLMYSISNLRGLWSLIPFLSLFMLFTIIECWYWGYIDFEDSMWICLCSYQISLDVRSRKFSLLLQMFIVFTVGVLFCCFQLFFSVASDSALNYIFFVFLHEVIYWHKFCETVRENLIKTAYDVFHKLFSAYFHMFFKTAY
jgi:hypothetical protein